VGDRGPRVLEPVRDLRAIPTRRSLLPPPRAAADAAGWRASWTYLFDAYAPAMERYVAAILRRSGGTRTRVDDAPDVVQAYLAACLEKGWLERDAGEIRCFRGWLKVQLRRFTLAWVRDAGAARRGGTLPADARLDDVEADAPDLDAALDAGLVEAAVARCVARLREGNEEYGEIVADLLRTEGTGSPDLAARLGRPAKDLAVLRHRARRRFAALFADELRATVRDPEAFDDLLARLAPHLP
jgi:DNA-directed RNA polymerase specialized sigma24 family protein